MKSEFKLCSFILFALQILLLLISNVKCVNDSGATKNANSCLSRNFLIISTVDGVVTALDMNTGEKCWSVVLDSEKFLSSSLSDLEIYEKDQRVWLVPSLDGGLYKYNNFRRLIQPLPVDADSLISQSIYFDSSTSVTGGKIKIVFGINRLTGEIIYVCKMDGCNNFKSPFPQDMLIVEELTQHVNALDTNKAEKKWHFRVSELKVKLTSELPSDNTSTFHNDTRNNNALIPRNYKDLLNLDTYKISLQNGYAGLINKTSHDFSWLFKAPCPITDAWYVKDNMVKILDPFDKESGFFSVEMDGGKHSALLFLGTFESQMFIKRSKNFPVKDTSLNSPSTNVLYQTYLVPVCPKSESHISLLNSTSNAEALMTTNWDFNATDYGSYFYMNFSVAENRTHCIINTSYIVRYDESVQFTSQFLAFYFGVSIIAILIFITLFPFAVIKLLSKDSVNIGTPPVEVVVKEEVVTDSEFRSRFDQDFEFLSVLGKGGFGVVLDARNRIDDCRYAVKRIRLHEQLNNLQYERVLREVKALAKLDHHGIVRYFNAWTEYPPMGWQEEKDKGYAIDDCSESSESSPGLESNKNCRKLQKSVSESKSVLSAEIEVSKSKKQKVLNSNIRKKLNQNPLAHFDDLLSDNYSDGYNLPSNSDKSSCSSFNSQEQSSDFETDQSSTGNDPSLEASHDYLNVPYEDGDDSSDSFIVFDEKKCDVSAKAIESEHFQKPIANENASDCEVKIPPEHIKCFNILGSFNDKLSCKLPLDIFTVLSSYFFHDEKVSGISVIERGDWRKAISHDEIINKLYFQQWLISILCLLQSPNDFPCSMLITNLCCILSDVNKTLNQINFIKNGYTLHSPQSSISDISEKESGFTDSTNQDVSSHVSSSIPTGNSSLVKDVSRGYLYIQMQLCQKESLRQWLDSNCDIREYDKVMKIFTEIVDAVHYVHICGLMHRDLKPSNIYFSLEGAIKIGDFGLATSSEIHEKASVHTSKQSSNHTSDIGTEIYMSPEQKLKQDYDCKTDIYSLGIILFELLVSFKTVSERYMVLSKARQCHFPEGFTVKYKNESKLVRHLLNENPASRPTADEIKNHLLLLKYSAPKSVE